MMKPIEINFVYFLLLLWSSIYCVQSLEKSGYFWHVSDMHWDPTYINNEAAWSCNDRTRPEYGDFGDFLCDSPWKLVNSAVKAMKDIHPDPDFLIWTGDDTPHIYNDTILNKEVVLDIIFNLTDLLQSYFPNTSTYSALGNHDWSPKSQLPPNPDPMYEIIADKWSEWIPTNDSQESFQQGGYYTLPIENSNIRMVILNTNLYYKSNEETEGLDDPADQYVWLENVLDKSVEDNEKVIIIGHVPPGVFEKHRDYSWYYLEYNIRFLDIVTRYADVISAMHFAHHHTDSFRVIYDEGSAVSSILLAPAVAPWETTLEGVMGGAGNNPAIRLVQYDTATGEVLNILQFYLNLTEANMIGVDEWKLEYNATEYYLEPDMKTASLHSLAQKLWTDEEMFSKYYSANGVLYDPEEVWDEETQIVHCCAITEVNFDEYAKCYNQNTSGSSKVMCMNWILIISTLVPLVYKCS